jgi:CubicO group peptidase (beta-lactamase class C family)
MLLNFKIVAITSFLLCGNLLFSQTNITPVFISDSLDKYINQAIKDWNVPALAVGIVKDDKVVWCKGYGILEVGKNESVNENTLFMIGSNTKLFTGTMAAMLEQQGVLKLDDKVTKWIPSFELKNKYASVNANLKDILSHRIGFETFQGDFTYWTSKLTREEIVAKMSKVDAVYDYRTKWGYCNAGYLTTGEVIEAATKQSWEDNIRKNILQPLQMNSTLMLAVELEKAKNYAKPYTWFNKKLTPISIPKLDNLAPAASISSNVVDMCKWLQLQLNFGKVNNTPLISEKAIAATRNPESIVGVNPRFNRLNHFTLYGLGLEIKDRKGYVLYSHTGGVNGYLSSVAFIPELKLGVVVLTTNDNQSLFQILNNQIMDAYLEVPYENYSKQALSGFILQTKSSENLIDSLYKVVAQKNKLPIDVNEFCGVYSNELYGKITIELLNQNLIMKFENHPEMTAKVEYTAANNFLISYSDPTMGIKEIPFKIKSNKVKGFTLLVNDFVEFTPYIFTKLE